MLLSQLLIAYSAQVGLFSFSLFHSLLVLTLLFFAVCGCAAIWRKKDNTKDHFGAVYKMSVSK